jgi:hypothetical protein
MLSGKVRKNAMMEEVLSLMLMFLETVGLYLFSEIFMDHRWNNTWKQILLIGIQCLSMYALLTVIEILNQPYINQLKFLFETVPMLIYVSIGYEGTAWKKIFCTISYLVFILIIDSLGLFVIYTWNPNILGFFSGMAIISLLCKGLECLIVFIFNQICGKRKYRYPINTRVWFQFLWFPIMTLVIMTIFLLENQWQEKSVLIISIVLLLSNLWLYFLLVQFAKKETENRTLLLQTEQTKRQAELYENLQNSYFEQRARAHEFQGYLKQIQNLLQQGQNEAVETYLAHIHEQIENRTKYYNTSNAIIDALINEKYRQAKKEGIVLSLKLADLSNLRMQEKDLVFIFTFLMDGVLNTCRRLNLKMANIFLEKEEEEWQILADISSEDRQFQEEEQEIWKKETTSSALTEILERCKGESFCYGSEHNLIFQVTFL